MKYILTAAWDDGVADLTARLVRELTSGKRVLWLLSGGSNIPTSVQIMDNISAEQSKKLTITLADERYGEPGHADSNWKQLLDVGFRGKQATLLQLLEPAASLEETLARYDKIVGKALEDNDVVIAQLGIGADGHVTGILPNSPAVSANTLVAAYDAPPLKRITITFPVLRKVTAAYVFAFGKPKHDALTALYEGKAQLETQPSQILNELPEAYLYSDQVGEHA